MFRGVQCVVQGADHIKANKICQDAATVYEADHFAVAAVSDGHGGAKYIRSDVGAKLAVAAAVETVTSYMKDYDAFCEAMKKDSDYVLNQMERFFLTEWNEKIEDHHDANVLTEAEQAILTKAQEKSKSNKPIDWHSYYGCTVLIAVLAEGFSYGMLIGDGTYAVVYDDATVTLPIEDPYSVANMTSSVCDKQSKDKFQHYYEEKQPISLTVSSDGLCKSFGSEESLKDYHVRLTYMMDSEQFANSLEKNLLNFTQKGSGDDISVASVFSPELLTAKKDFLLKEIEEKKKIEQERRAAEAKRVAEAKRKLEEARAAEEKRRQEEERRKQEEALRQQTLRKQAEERRRQKEEARRQEAERRRLDKEQQILEAQIGQDVREMQQQELIRAQKENEELKRRLEEMEREKQKIEIVSYEYLDDPLYNADDPFYQISQSMEAAGQKLKDSLAVGRESLARHAAELESWISQRQDERSGADAAKDSKTEETKKE